MSGILLGDAVLDLSVDRTGLRTGMAAARSEAETETRKIGGVMNRAMAREMQTVGRTMTRYMTLPILGVGAAAAKMSMDFQRSMEMIHTQAGASQQEVDKLKKKVLELAEASIFSPEELAKGLYHFESVGLRGAKAMQALDIAQKGAMVGGAELESVANALAAAWKSGIKGAQNMSEAMGELNAIVGTGNMKMPELVEALSSGILPRAKMAGLTLKDVGAALAELADEGTPASNAARLLATSLHYLYAPTTQAQKALKSIGMTTTQMTEDLRKPNGLAVALGDLRDHLDHLSHADRLQVLNKIIPGARGFVLTSLMENLDKYEEKIGLVSKGATNFAANVRKSEEEDINKLHKAWSTIQADLIRLGGVIVPPVTEALTDAAAAVGHLSEVFQKLSPGTRDMILRFALLAAAIGPAMVMVGKLGETFMRLRTLMMLPFKGMSTEMKTSLAGAIPIAAEAGTTAGEAYGQAFAAATKIALARGESLSAGGVVLPPGMRSVAAEGGSVAPGVASASVTSMLRGTASRAMRGGIIALIGTTLAESIGWAVGGKTGSAVSSVGKDAAFGAAFGTLFGPEGTIAGGVLGGLYGGFQTFIAHHAGEEGKKIADHLEKTIAPGVSSGLRKGIADSAKQELDKIHAERNALEQNHENWIEKGLESLRIGVKGDERHGISAKQRGELEAKEYAVGYKIAAQSVRLETGLISNVKGLNSAQRAEMLAGAIITNTEKQLAGMPGAMRQGAYQSILAFTRGLQQDGKLPPQAIEQLVRTLTRKFPELTRAFAHAGESSMAAIDRAIKGQKVLGDIEALVNSWHQLMPEIPHVVGLNMTNAESEIRHVMDRLAYLMHHGPQLQREAASAEYRKFKQEAARYFDEMTHHAEQTVRTLSQKLPHLSATGVQALLAAYRVMQEGIEGRVNAGVISTEDGVKRINEVLSGELKALGLKPAKLAKLPGQKTSPLMEAGMPGLEGFTGVESEHAGGGIIGALGMRGHDSVHALLAPGEAVLNYHHQGPVETALAYTQAMGVQPYGSLTDLFSHVSRPHHMASGGLAGGVKHIGAPRVHLKGVIGQIAQGAVDDAAKAANRKLASAMPPMGAGIGGSAAGSAQMRAWAAAGLRAAGVPATGGNIGLIIGRMMQESGGNPRAINLWDINAKEGHPSKGLMQLIPENFATYHVAGTSDNIYDPVANVAAAVRYMLGRYGHLVGSTGSGYALGGFVLPHVHRDAVRFAGGGHVPTIVGTRPQQSTAGMPKRSKKVPKGKHGKTVQLPAMPKLPLVSEINHILGQQVPALQERYQYTSQFDNLTEYQFVVTPKEGAPYIDENAVSMRLGQLQQLYSWQVGVQHALGESLHLFKPVIEHLEHAIERRKKMIERLKRKIEENLKKLAKLEEQLKKTRNERVPLHLSARAKRDWENKHQARIDELEKPITALKHENEKLGGSESSVGSGGRIGRLEQQASKLTDRLNTVRGDKREVVGYSGTGGQLGDTRYTMAQLAKQIGELSPIALGKALSEARATSGESGSELLQRQNQQLEERLALAKEEAQINARALSVFAGSGDIGSGAKNALAAAALPFGGSFAKGGIIPGPVGAPTVIVAHGGETVTPVGGHTGPLVHQEIHTLHPGDPQVLDAVARAAVAGIGYQGGRIATRKKVGV